MNVKGVGVLVCAVGAYNEVGDFLSKMDELAKRFGGKIENTSSAMHGSPNDPEHYVRTLVPITGKPWQIAAIIAAIAEEQHRQTLARPIADFIDVPEVIAILHRLRVTTLGDLAKLTSKTIMSAFPSKHLGHAIIIGLYKEGLTPADMSYEETRDFIKACGEDDLANLIESLVLEMADKQGRTDPDDVGMPSMEFLGTRGNSTTRH